MQSDFIECACGCGARLTPLDAWGRPRRFISGHNARGTKITRTRTPAAPRFWAKVSKSEWCWLWTGSKNEHGYGQLRVNGRSQKAHRLSYELTNGPIPEGLHVLHRCDTPACVRPDHLYAGTRSMNMQDAVARNRHARHSQPGEASPHARLTNEVVISIRNRFQAGEGYTALARAFDLSKGHVWGIVQRKTWKNLP